MPGMNSGVNVNSPLVVAAFKSALVHQWIIAMVIFTVLCLADWVLIEDSGFLGGLGTDPNSMIPFAQLAISGYLALTPFAVLLADAARQVLRPS